jgi:uncharacterized protein
MEFQPSERPPLPPPFAPEPVLARERIVTLDVIRGVAIFGILTVNIQFFAMTDAVRNRPWLFEGVDYHIWHVVYVFFKGKFLTIFAALFGAGILLMTDHATERGFSPLALHFRRMAGLLLIGMIHAYLIWDGDILVNYALCGCVVVWFRRVRARWLIPLALCMLIIPFLVSFLWFIYPENSVLYFISGEWFSPDAAYHGSWLEQMPSRARESFERQTAMFARYTFWQAGAVMLLGMVLFRSGILSGARPTRFYVATLVLAGVPALVVLELGLPDDWTIRYWGSLFLALAWIALAVLMTRTRWLDSFTAALAAVGRMALTNYLMQSVICTWIFYGHGLGWYDNTRVSTQLLIVVAIAVFQLIASSLWLRWFRFGPIEYLWRWATYGRRPAFLHGSVSLR